jgi:hemerythrin-like domain-containing protein
MAPKEIAEWMREEHQAVGELTQHLRDRVAVLPRAGLKQWITETAAELAEFQAHLTKHFDLEETGGYLEAVTHQSPALSPEVDRLRHEHDEIGRILESIHRELVTTTEHNPILIEDCCCRVQNLLRYIKEHEEREDLMIVSVFTSDLGEG